MSGLRLMMRLLPLCLVAPQATFAKPPPNIIDPTCNLSCDFLNGRLRGAFSMKSKPN